MAPRRLIPVTDPEILRQLEEGENPQAITRSQEVTDPEILKQLNAPETVNTILGKMPKQQGRLFENRPQTEAKIQELLEQFGPQRAGRAIEQFGKTLFPTYSQNLASLGKKLSPLFKSKESFEKSAEEANLAHEAALQAEKQPEQGFLTAKPTNELEDIENAITRELNIGGAHNVRNASLLQKRISSIENYWKDRWGKFEKDIADNNIQLPEISTQGLSPEKIVEKIAGLQKQGKKLNMQDIKNMQGEMEITSPQFKDLITDVPPPGQTSATQFLDQYRSFNKKLGEMQGLTKQNIDPLFRKQLFKDIEKGKSIQKMLKDILENGLGNFSKEFKELNEGYSTQVHALRNNPTARKIMEGKPLSKNMAEELSGTHEGQETLRRIAKEDPEVVRNILGQLYSKKRESLFNPNETIQEYLNESPEIKRLIQGKQNTLQKLAKRKDISLQEKVKAEKELEKFSGKQKKLRYIAGGAAGGAALGLIGVPSGKKLLNYLLGD